MNIALIKLTIRLFFGFIILSTTTLSAQKIDSLNLKNELKIKYLDKKEYKIAIPENWTVDKDCKDDLCSLFSPSDTLSYYDIFIENLNITVAKLPTASYTAENYSTYSRGYLPTVVKNYKLLNKKKLKPNVSMIEFTGIKNNFDQTWQQYYFVKRQKVYILTFAIETKKYAYYTSNYKNIFNTFILK